MSQAALVVAIASLVAFGAAADDLASANFRIRAAHTSTSGATLASASFSSTGAVGQSEPPGPSGGATDLTTLAPGFFPILVADFPTLDGDNDGRPYFLDTDDDGDGLDDAVETNTGSFGSPSDTGSDSLLADSDGDGFWDGVEVLAGTDPNDPLSTPIASALPALGTLSRGLAVAVILLSAVRLFRRRNHASARKRP